MKQDRLLRFTEGVCPICGKTFIIQPEHIYKVRKYGQNYTTYCCSWTCQLKGERERKKQRELAKQKRAQKKKEKEESNG